MIRQALCISQYAINLYKNRCVDVKRQAGQDVLKTLPLYTKEDALIQRNH